MDDEYGDVPMARLFFAMIAKKRLTSGCLTKKKYRVVI